MRVAADPSATTAHFAVRLACYQQGELHRLVGEAVAAEKAYRAASRASGEPQPGLALLQLAGGRTDAALAGICRALNGTEDRVERARLLPARVEIMLAASDVAGARTACGELDEIATRFPGGALEAIAAQARAAVDLAGDDAGAALISVRQALSFWQQVEAPYEIAQLRVLAGQVCRALATTTVRNGSSTPPATRSTSWVPHPTWPGSAR
ncbi:MAG: hypothetical protein L0H64_16000 [Pseudonocardia sp.]|nr:hypothetical protein [Pseudonocardia sp.]